MIASLRGQILEKDGGTAVVDVAGVGYLVFCSRGCLSAFEIGDSVHITTYTEVREDAIKLYGFTDKLEKQVFLLLNLVKGIGPKSALEIVSQVEPRELLKLIGRGEVGRIQDVRGIGRKTAERIVVELKDKVAPFAIEQQTQREWESEPLTDAVLALQALGFSRRDAERAVTEAKNAGVQLQDSGGIVREALKFI